MNKFWLTFILLGTLACGGSDSLSNSFATVDGFCEAYAAELCGRLDGCGLNQVSIADCTASVRPQCGRWKGLGLNTLQWWKTPAQCIDGLFQADCSAFANQTLPAACSFTESSLAFGSAAQFCEAVTVAACWAFEQCGSSPIDNWQNCIDEGKVLCCDRFDCQAGSAAATVAQPEMCVSALTCAFNFTFDAGACAATATGL